MYASRKLRVSPLSARISTPVAVMGDQLDESVDQVTSPLLFWSNREKVLVGAPWCPLPAPGDPFGHIELKGLLLGVDSPKLTPNDLLSSWAWSAMHELSDANRTR